MNPDKIKSLKDVKGKRIATPQLGNTQDVAFLNWAAEQGWKVDAQSGKGDVTVVRSDNKVTPDAYKSGSVDGAWVPEPTASKLVAEGGKVLLDEASLWPDKKFVITNIIVSPEVPQGAPEGRRGRAEGLGRHQQVDQRQPGRRRRRRRTSSWRTTPARRCPPMCWTRRGSPSSSPTTRWPPRSTPRRSTRSRRACCEKPDLKGIYDLTPLNKVLKAEGEPAVDDAGLGAK